MTHHQHHGKFKLFLGQPSATDPLGGLGEQVAAFVKSAGVAAKSIGTEYLESKKSLVVTIGYRDDEPGYAVRLECVKLASTSGLADPALLEAQMAEAAEKFPGIICHELFITDEGDFYMVFMIHVA